MSEVICSDVKEQNRDGMLEISCTDGQDFDSEQCNVESKGNIQTEVNSTSSETGLSSGSYLTDAGTDHDDGEHGERLTESNLLQTSSLDFHEARGRNICEGNSSEQPEVPESATYSSKMFVHDETDKYECYGDFGDWMVYWDSFYLRNYFYNIKTKTSTWYPPEGMEHLAICDITNKSNETVAELIEMDAGPAINASDFCIIQNKIDSSKESMNSCVLHGQAYDELSEGGGLTVCNSVSAMNVSVTLSRNIEDSDELNKTNETFKDGSEEWLLSDNKENVIRYLYVYFSTFSCGNLLLSWLGLLFNHHQI